MIKIKTNQRPNPKDANADRKYYVSVKNAGEITLEEMSENISDRCTLTETDVLAALNAMQREMVRNLLEGKIVRFGTFGSFQVSLSSKGVEKAEDSSTDQIRGMKVLFRPGIRVNKKLRDAKFTLVQE